MYANFLKYFWGNKLIWNERATLGSVLMFGWIHDMSTATQ